MIDPLRRWSGIGEKPDYAGALSYGGVPYTQEPSDLGGADVVIVGAPTDELVSDRPDTRFAPRAIRAASCPPGPNLETGVDAFAELRVLDFGDAPVVPADPARSHAAIARYRDWPVGDFAVESVEMTLLDLRLGYPGPEVLAKMPLKQELVT